MLMTTAHTRTQDTVKLHQLLQVSLLPQIFPPGVSVKGNQQNVTGVTDTAAAARLFSLEFAVDIFRKFFDLHC
jgi:hypothetical protein